MTRPVTPAETARHLRRLAERRQRDADVRSEKLLRLLPESAALLRTRYSADCVILFGSLAAAKCRANSDVDLAVSGLRRDRYFAALSDLMALFGVPVDLVRLEEAPDSLRQRISAEGETL